MIVSGGLKTCSSFQGGLDAFIRTYRAGELYDRNLPLGSPSPAFVNTTLPEACTTSLSLEESKHGWNWFPWIGEKPLKNWSMPPFKPLKVPESTTSAHVEVLPIYTSESTVHFHLVSHPDTLNASSSSVVLSCDSGTMSSSGTNESIATTQISALERLEAYISVLGTPECEPVRPRHVKKYHLFSLEQAEEAARTRGLREPVRKPIQLPLVPLTAIIQGKPLEITNRDSSSTLRWMTGYELRSQNIAWKPVDHRLEVLKGNRNPPKPKLSSPKITKSNATKPQLIIVDGDSSGSHLSEASPLDLIKKRLEERLLKLRRGRR
jgi:hypothetical protein